ncbi:MAG: hypothetical protein M3Q71_16075 [Chloroflexota bacterium]|nr:hypothetical protein [Chloroflexota bacterium]
MSWAGDNLGYIGTRISSRDPAWRRSLLLIAVASDRRPPRPARVARLPIPRLLVVLRFGALEATWVAALPGRRNATMASTTAAPRDFWRLAEEAERRGIRILIEPISGEHFATSSTQENALYRLTHYSCTCKGFLHWQRCTHHSLLLAQLGWLPDPEPDPDPSPASPTLPSPELVPCPDCDGTGRVVAYFGPDDEQGEIDCRACGGAGEIEPDRIVELDGDSSAHDAPYDHGSYRPSATPLRRNAFNVTDEELVVLRGEAARLHAERGWPLVDFETGEILDPGGHRAA